MGGLSDVYENHVLDALLGAGFTKPSTVYVGLFTTLPTDAGGGVEPSVGAYARVSMTNNATNWPAASASQKANGVVVAFPIATAAWGTVVGFGIFDTPTTDSLIVWGALMSPQVVGLNALPSFAIGTLLVTAD